MEFSGRLLNRLKNAYTVGVLTGAGISASSGVPVFRGEDGLWNKFRPEELANFDAFLRNPELVWEWYNWRRQLMHDVKPNLSHKALVVIERLFSDFGIITQNVDNLHRMAGSKNVIELHGNILRNKCSQCGKIFKGEIDVKDGVPACPDCSGNMRPDVVWFGELLPEQALQEAQDLAMRSEVFFSIGTSSLVEPAASLPYMAKGNGAYVVEINPEKTPLTHSADEHIEAPSDKILPKLVFALQKIRK